MCFLYLRRSVSLSLGGGGPQKYTVVMDRGEEEMMAQLHVLKTCIRLSVKQRRVSGLIYQIGNVCLAFIK